MKLQSQQTIETPGPSLWGRAGTWVLRIAIAGALADLLWILVHGSHGLPFTSRSFKEPCTDVFFILVFIILERLWVHRLNHRAWERSQKNLLLFILVWLTFLATFRWHGSGDVIAASLQPFALIRQGNLYLDPYYEKFLSDESVSCIYRRGGHIHSVHSSGPGLLLTPFYLIPALSGIEVTDLLLHQLQKFGASAMVALSAYFLLLGLELIVPRSWALMLTVAYAFGTSCLSLTSQAIWQHGPSQLFICLGLYTLLKSTMKRPAGENNEWQTLLLTGFSLGLAIWCRFSDVFVFGSLALFVLLKFRQRILPFAAGAVLPALAILGDNYFQSGHILKSGYQPESMIFLPHPLLGSLRLLVSPARGLFLYSPFLLFSVWGFFRAIRQRGSALWRSMAAAFSLVLVFYACSSVWEGGFSFGTRYLSDVTPLLILGITPIVADLAKTFWMRRCFFFSIAYSVLVHAIGGFFSWDWESSPPKIWSGSNYPVSYLMNQALTPSSRDFVEGIVVWSALGGLLLWFVRPLLRKSKTDFHSRFDSEELS